jgi:hypothetical protein
LNIDLDINNERQNYKIGTVGGIVGGEEGEQRRLGEGIWLMDFIYLYEIEQRNFLQLL